MKSVLPLIRPGRSLASIPVRSVKFHQYRAVLATANANKSKIEFGGSTPAPPYKLHRVLYINSTLPFIPELGLVLLIVNFARSCILVVGAAFTSSTRGPSPRLFLSPLPFGVAHSMKQSDVVNRCV